MGEAFNEDTEKTGFFPALYLGPWEDSNADLMPGTEIFQKYLHLHVWLLNLVVNKRTRKIQDDMPLAEHINWWQSVPKERHRPCYRWHWAGDRLVQQMIKSTLKMSLACSVRAPEPNLIIFLEPLPFPKSPWWWSLIKQDMVLMIWEGCKNGSENCGSNQIKEHCC